MKFVGLDIETTGLHMEQNHRLIQIGVVFEKRNSFVRDVYPEGEMAVDPEAMLVNGFTAERVRRATPQRYVDELLARFIEDLGYTKGSLTAVGWNVGSFDLPFIKKELPKTAVFFSHRVVDLTSIAIFLSGGEDNWRELKATEHKTIEERLMSANWHDAGYDALAALLQWQKWMELDLSLIGGA